MAVREFSARVATPSTSLHQVIRHHAHLMMIIDMANNLPQSWIGSIHVQGLAYTVVKTDSERLPTVVHKTVAMHMEDVALGAEGVRVPDGLVVDAHLVRWVVGVDVAVHAV